MADYASYALFRIAGFILRLMPVPAALWCGRVVGGMLRVLDIRHRAVVDANIRAAFGARLSYSGAARIGRNFYSSLGQSLIEILLIPRVDKEYISRYISIEGREHAEEAFRRGKGVIFLGVHEGSWEMYNIVAANIGYPVNLLVADQGADKRVARLLNRYRTAQGCKLIFRKNQTRELLRVLKNNEAIGMSLDQGGRTGVLVPFFGKEAAMATGAVRLALRYGAAIVPVFYRRVKGPRARITLLPPHQLSSTGNDEADAAENVRRLSALFEKLISDGPEEYFWRYKIWKYGRQRTIAILSDGKAGHVRQSQSVARQAARVYADKGVTAKVETVEVRFPGKVRRVALNLLSLFAGRLGCQGCLRACVTGESARALYAARPDVVISCGSALAPVAYLMGREFLARTVVVMKPTLIGLSTFDLVVVPRHDNPPRARRNVCEVEGALNLIDEQYLEEQARGLIGACGGRLAHGRPYVGVLIGGNTRHFRLDEATVRAVIDQVRGAARALGAEVLLTTSRRTPPAAQKIIKEMCGRDPLCALTVVANEKNIPEAVGGILGLSTVVVASPESISMISEAASSGKYAVVFDSPAITGKHRAFLTYFAEAGYVSVVDAGSLGARVKELWRLRPGARVLDNAEAVRRALANIL